MTHPFYLILLSLVYGTVSGSYSDYSVSNYTYGSKTTRITFRSEALLFKLTYFCYTSLLLILMNEAISPSAYRQAYYMLIRGPG